MKSENFINKLKDVFPIHDDYPNRVDPQLGISRFYAPDSSLVINVYNNKNFDVYKDGHVILIDVPVKDVSSVIQFLGLVHINMENGSTIKVYV